MTRGSPLSHERWTAAQPVLDAALELAPAQRATFLDGACTHDAQLRADVDELLAACERADGMLRTPVAEAFGSLFGEPEPPLPAELGGRYHIVREIGRGGMATVYLADDPKHARQVAVKVLHVEVARLIGHARFLREIEIAASLSHPHILPLHDSGTVPSDEGDEPAFLYFASPFVAGESLRERLARERRLPVDEALRLAREVAEALDYAHRQGVVHLDIKPENILLLEGHAVVTDFGIARVLARTGPDMIGEAAPLLGTPAYMSPEQAAAADDVDARSDVYSLGCVLREMLTGVRPGDGPAPLPPDVPGPVVALIERATAPARARRFPTSAALADALGEATDAPWPAPKPRRVAWAMAGVALAFLLGVLVALARFRSSDGDALDADLVAVAPFDVEAPALALWREGLVDVMSRNLDGAGALHTVPASVVVRRWQGRADAPSARALGSRTHARLVLYGGLLSAGDSVRATVVLLDTKTGRAVAELERRDVALRVDRLADSLTVAVLREIGRARRTDVARATDSPTRSLAALKAYLRGEQFYRAARWDSAQAHFEQAVVADSAFALAYHRLAAVRKWRDPRAIPDSATFALMRRPSRFTHGLAPRERLLARIDSLSAEAYFAWRAGQRDVRAYADYEAIVGRLTALFADGDRRYPDDAELAFLRADARARFDPDVVPGELDDRAILALYDRAIALDSSFAPAYVPPITLAAYLDGAAAARRYTRAYLALARSGPAAQAIALADALLDPARAPTLDVATLVDTLSPDGLCEVVALLRHVADSSETVVRIARQLGAGHGRASAARGPDCALARTIEGLEFRGHLRDAHRLATAQAHWLRPTISYDLARFGMAPADSTRAEFRRILSLAPRTKITKLYGWWASDGDTAAIQTYVRQFGAAEGALRSPSGGAMLRASVAAGRAYLALARRDTAGALRLFAATRDTLHECWYENRSTVVRLLVAAHRYGEAAARTSRRWPGTTACSDGVDDVLWTMDRARSLDRLGRRAEAASAYALVAEAWRTADPELQPYVQEARHALERLRRG